MYYHLTEAIQRRFILELRRYWSHHPKYRDLPDHIQGKYSFRERPQRAIILKISSANQVQLSADNYLGIVESHVLLAKVPGYNGLAVEWVREDGRAIQDNNGVFPSSAGIYYLDFTEDDEFYVDPLLEVIDESVSKVDNSTFQLQARPLAGTTRLFEMPGSLPLYEGTNYTLTLDSEGAPTGEIVLLKALGANGFLSADYRYPAASTGPWKLKENTALNRPVPGCILAFGRRAEKGDRVAVVVQRKREPSAMEYGGRWDISLDFEVLARDVHEQREMVDQTVMYLWGIARNRLSTEGIEISNVTMGGESEEPYDETGDDYFYNAQFSVEVQTDWAIHVPMTAMIRRVQPQTHAQASAAAGMSDVELATDEEHQLLAHEQLGLMSFRDPYFKDRTSTFEKIR